MEQHYRLSALGFNRNKNSLMLLDPVGLAPVTFVINFASGEILPNPHYLQQITLRHKPLLTA